MGKIFGISDNPVSTIESALKPLELKVEPSNIYPVKYLNRDTDKTDKFISKEKQNKCRRRICKTNQRQSDHHSGSVPVQPCIYGIHPRRHKQALDTIQI